MTPFDSAQGGPFDSAQGIPDGSAAADGSRRPWRAGVIAAGLGERLRSAAAGGAKPLVAVGGRALIEHVLTSLAEARPSEVVIIVNDASLAVKRHVSSRTWPFGIRWIVETTPSSMHSFLRVVETLADAGDDGPFLMSTVDTIAPAGAFAAFASAARACDAEVALAVAPPPDDEKPLYVNVEGPPGRMRVTAIGKAAHGAPWATAGYYAVRASVLKEADAARRDGLMALRAFLERLLQRGHRLAAVSVAGGVDVDRPSDIDAAERFLGRADA